MTFGIKSNSIKTQVQDYLIQFQFYQNTGQVYLIPAKINSFIAFKLFSWINLIDLQWFKSSNKLIILYKAILDWNSPYNLFFIVLRRSFSFKFPFYLIYGFFSIIYNIDKFPSYKSYVLIIEEGSDHMLQELVCTVELGIKEQH